MRNSLNKQITHLEWSRENLLKTTITSMKPELTYDFIKYALNGLYYQNDEDGSFDPVDVDDYLAFELSEYAERNKRTTSSTANRDILAAIKAKR